MLFSYFIEHNRYLNIFGIVAVLALATLFSKKRSAINKRLIINALLLQFIIGFIVLKTKYGYYVVKTIADAISMLYGYAGQGTAFLFGNLTNVKGPWGFVFAIDVLPIVIFFSAFMSLLLYAGVIQFLIRVINRIVQPLLGTSGPETLCAIANSFLGQTEAPLLIKHCLPLLTNSEMFVIMVSGMGTLSGAIIAVYSAMGVPALHLLTASVMAIPSTIIIAKIIYPQTETIKNNEAVAQKSSGNVLDALAHGISDGLSLALNIGAMLIAFIALIALINAVLAGLCTSINSVLSCFKSSLTIPCLTLQTILGYLFAPFGYLLGLRGNYALQAGQLIGTKVALNEMVAYSDLVSLHLPERAQALLTYALCGFSNFACIGIQIGGIGALAPSRKTTISELGLYAVLGGALSNLLTAYIAGLLMN